MILWQAVVLINKGGGDYRVLGLVEVVWMVVMVIPHRWFIAFASFHNKLYGLLAGRGTRTASLESKILQQLAAARKEVLCTIFLDLNKAYYALERDIFMEILEGYGIGPYDFHILREYWDRLWTVDGAWEYYR